MTNPITPEVRAAIERLRDGNYWRGDPVSGEYWDGDDHDQDAAKVVDAMLSLFLPGMPEPVEMWASDNLTTAIDCYCGPGSIRGLFVPLERVEA